jgi:hypothetical protein
MPADATVPPARCQFFLHGECSRPPTHEYKSKGRPDWIPICTVHADLALQLYGGQTRKAVTS